MPTGIAALGRADPGPKSFQRGDNTTSIGSKAAPTQVAIAAAGRAEKALNLNSTADPRRLPGQAHVLV